MPLRLFDLCTADREVRLSPYCWLVRLALLHKGLDFETVPLGFTEKENYPDPDYGMLPVLEDGGELVRDSAAIIAHLERKYPDRPLTATPGEKAAADFYTAWLGAAVYPALGPLTYLKVHDQLDAAGKAYFRATREKRFGRTLEELASDQSLPARMETALRTLAAPLEKSRFIGGNAANLGDYILMSPFLWRRAVTRDDPWKTPQAVADWQERMLDLFDGHARRAKTAA